jgi:hypothetical protein
VAKRRTWALIALAGGTALLAYFAPRGAEQGLQAATAGAGSTSPKAGFAIPDNLPKRRAIRALKKDLFRAPPPPPPPPPAPEAPLPPPHNPYRFAGTSAHNGVLQIWLGTDKRVYEVRPGEMLDDAWRVQSVSREAVVLLHVPRNVEQRIEPAVRPN